MTTVPPLDQATNTPLTGDEILAIHQGVEMDDIQWLPDSSRIIFRSRFTDSTEFWSTNPQGEGPSRLTVGSSGSTLRVAPNGRWLSYLSSKSGSSEVWLHPLISEEGTEDRQLTHLGADVNSANWAPDGRTMVVGCNRYGSYDVYEISVPDGDWHRLTSDTDSYEHYPVYTPDGESIAYVRLNDTWEDHDIVAIDRRGNETRLLVRDQDFFDYQMGRRFGHPVISPDGRWLLFRSHRSNWINYWIVDLQTQHNADQASPHPLCLEDFDQSAESGSINCGEAAWSPDSRFVAYLSNRNGNVQLRVASPHDGTSVIVAAAEEGVASNPAWSPDGRHIAFLYQSFTTPPDVWVTDVDQRAEELIIQPARQLTFSMPQALERKFAPPEKVEYKSFDGTVIQAYVYRPQKQPTGPGPAIIEIHGGPVDQFRDTMHVVVQYYVQRGYTVLMANIRGSAGYGKDFEELIKTGWGIDDLKDLVEGARYMVDSEFADPSRIGATGQSYGGSMSMEVACSAPQGMFQASISRTGYADWGYYQKHGSQRTVKLLNHSLGKFEENEALYEASAALNKVSNAQTPVFVIDQETDPTEPRPDRRHAFVAQLRGLGKPVTYKSYKNTGGPYARHPSGAKEMLPDMIAYFKKHLG